MVYTDITKHAYLITKLFMSAIIDFILIIRIYRGKMLNVNKS